MSYQISLTKGPLESPALFAGIRTGEFLGKTVLSVQDGFVRSVRLIDDKGTETILSALKDLRAGKEVTLRDIEKHLDGTLFQNIAVMRCGNCGWVALFDKTFIENEIHNAKNK